MKKLPEIITAIIKLNELSTSIIYCLCLYRGNREVTRSSGRLPNSDPSILNVSVEY